MYNSKIDNAGNLPTTVPAVPNELLIVKHNLANKDAKETLYFKIKVTLDDNFSPPDGTDYVNDYDPSIPPTT